ncbi:unnamed protein product [Lampetra fluviatilis]
MLARVSADRLERPSPVAFRPPRGEVAVAATATRPRLQKALLPLVAGAMASTALSGVCHSEDDEAVVDLSQGAVDKHRCAVKRRR